MSVETDGIRHASNFFEKQGFEVEDVSHNSAHRGCDLLITRGPDVLRVEVKGCTRPWQIPDPYVTEFDSEHLLVADYLCVVYLMNPDAPDLCLIPRDAIPPEYVKPKSGYRISSKFKKRAVLEKYLQPYTPGDGA